MTAVACPAGDPWPYSPPYPTYQFAEVPPPRTMPVNLPVSSFGVTIAVLDRDGNLTVKVNQPEPPC